jgi:hypothetical protein
MELYIRMYIKGYCRVRYNYELQTRSEDGDTVTLIRMRTLNRIDHINRMDKTKNLSKISTVNWMV